MAKHRDANAELKLEGRDEFIRENGNVYPVKNEKGAVTGFRRFPHTMIASRLGDQLLRLEQEFGLSPSARTRIRLDNTMREQSAEEEMLRFIASKPAP